MKFYITIENEERLKRSFLNLKLFSIIDISQILNEYNYSINTIDKYGSFIVNNKINKLIKNYTSSKRIRGIIYSNPFLNAITINNIFDKINDIEKIDNVVLLDDYNIPKLKHLYYLFNEIIYFPSIKKIRLIEAKPINENISWK